MLIALVQQRATNNKAANLERGLRALEEAATEGAQIVCFAELAFEPFYPQKPASGDVRDRSQLCDGMRFLAVRFNCA